MMMQSRRLETPQLQRLHLLTVSNRGPVLPRLLQPRLDLLRRLKVGIEFEPLRLNMVSRQSQLLDDAVEVDSQRD
jgi:hypothetical protein